MARLNRGIAPKGKASKMNWDATDDPDVVAEYGWQDEEETLWTCTMCKRYVKMKHLMKLWPRAQARISGPRREGLASSCQSAHFLHRYHEVTIAVDVRNSRPEIMLYSNMAMVWAEIVLHKDVDWRTVAGLNVSLLDRSQHFIPTTWNQPSDCWPRWSNRKYGVNSDIHQQRQTPPREYEGHNYNDFNQGNDMGSAPISFRERSGSHHFGGSHYGTTINTPRSYTSTYDSCPISPRKEEEHHTSNYVPAINDGYGRGTYGSDNTPPQPFQTHEDEDAEFERQMLEATRQSQEEYIQKLEDETHFLHRQYNNLYDVFLSGPFSSGAGPSRRRNSDSDED